MRRKKPITDGELDPASPIELRELAVLFGFAASTLKHTLADAGCFPLPDSKGGIRYILGDAHQALIQSGTLGAPRDYRLISEEPS